MSYLQQLKLDMAFLQETHCCNSSVALLKESWVGQVFHFKFNAKARIHINILFHREDIISDTNGRYVIVTGHFFSSNVILVNVYAL